MYEKANNRNRCSFLHRINYLYPLNCIDPTLSVIQFFDPHNRYPDTTISVEKDSDRDKHEVFLNIRQRSTAIQRRNRSPTN